MMRLDESPKRISARTTGEYNSQSKTQDLALIESMNMQDSSNHNG